jgi:hypothetical protein
MMPSIQFPVTWDERRLKRLLILQCRYFRNLPLKKLNATVVSFEDKNIKT